MCDLLGGPKDKKTNVGELDRFSPCTRTNLWRGYRHKAPLNVQIPPGVFEHLLLLDGNQVWPYSVDRAIPTIKGTYSLDEQTIRALEQTARRWKTSKSEVVRRAILAVARGELPTEPSRDALAALDALQSSLGLKPEVAQGWREDVREERRASLGPGEPAET